MLVFIVESLIYGGFLHLLFGDILKDIGIPIYVLYIVGAALALARRLFILFGGSFPTKTSSGKSKGFSVDEMVKNDILFGDDDDD
ncbi:MAG: hypothetical protein IK121_01415 [Lachnospiraceae bacterium]|nr:hypothetical protein [Lachnospiraceae bacterium]